MHFHVYKQFAHKLNVIIMSNDQAVRLKSTNNLVFPHTEVRLILTILRKGIRTSYNFIEFSTEVMRD